MSNLIAKFDDLNNIDTPDNEDLLKELVEHISTEIKLDLCLNVNEQVEDRKYEIILKETNTVVAWIESKDSAIDNDDDMPCIEFNEDNYDDVGFHVLNVVEGLGLYNDVI